MRDFFISIFLFLSCGCNGAELIHYSSLLEHGSEIALSTDRKSASIGHIGVNASPCDIGRQEVCIIFDEHLFAAVSNDMRVENYSIRYLGIVNVKIFAVEMDLHKVSVVSDKFEDTYWFNETQGVQIMRLGLKSTGESALFFLRGKCGYGASSACHQMTLNE